MMTVTLAFSVFIYAVNKGGFRVYLLVGVAVGMLVYHHTVGKIVMLLSETIVGFIRKAVVFVLIKPAAWAIRLLMRFIGWIWKNTAIRIAARIKKCVAIAYTENVMKRIGKDIRFEMRDRKGRAQGEKII